MKIYFTISEYAKLRNININSLRYYEKIGILKPAKIDENSGYRYYVPEQLVILDAILFCIHVGLPLKELNTYIDSQNYMYNEKLFESGKELAEKRIREIQVGLEKIQYTLRYMDANKSLNPDQALYERNIIKRHLVAMPYHGDLGDGRALEIASGELYKFATEQNLSPVFPVGLIVRRTSGKLSVKLFLEIIDHDSRLEEVIVVQEGIYLCRQIELSSAEHLKSILDATYQDCDKEDIIISNFFQSLYKLGTKICEIQKRIANGKE